jgi:hypothetical protein
MAMLGRLRRSGSRQFAAVILIFALMLQGLAVAAAGWAVNAAGEDPDWPGFEICHHNDPADAGANTDAGNATMPGGAPQGSGVHCIFCLAGAAQGALEALLPSTAFHVVLCAIVPWPFTEWRLPPLTVDASARPRGPPSA